VLKKFIKKKWHENKDFMARKFKMFLEWCVNVVGDNAYIVENHFYYVGISITQPSISIYALINVHRYHYIAIYMCC
jgi:hypothetical protein